LDQINWHLVKHALDEDKESLCLSDVLKSVAKPVAEGNMQESISKQFKEQQTDKLKKWGMLMEDLWCLWHRCRCVWRQ
jgi:hypothetical protein